MTRSSIIVWGIFVWNAISISVLCAQSGLNDKHLAFLTNHCADCHEGADSEGGFDLEKLGRDLNSEASFFKWERVFERLQKNEMPPEDYDQPEVGLKSKFLESLNSNLTAAHQKRRSTVLRRLNRSEYENTLNDLFGVKLNLKDLLPEDSRSHEFDNVGSALNTSMVHLEKYLEATRLVLDSAIAKSSVAPKVNRIEGSYANVREGKEFIGKIWKKLPDGSVVRFSGGGYPSGMIRSTNVRQPGRYRVKVTGYAYQSITPITFSVGGTTFKKGADKPTYGYFAFAPGEPQTIEFEADIETNYMVQIEPYGISDPERYKRKSIEGYQGPGLAIQSVVLEGPLADQFPSPGHQLVFDGIKRVEIEPRDPRQKLKPWYKPKFRVESKSELADATRSLKRVVAFAFRRRISDEEVKPFIELFQSQRKEGQSFEDSLRQAVTAVFCSPGFLFLNEEEGELDDFAIASRLSYFLHRTLPDKKLLQLASAERLRDRTVRLEQVERLISEPRFDRFINDFCDSWLNLREMDFTVPDSVLFPEYDQYLRYSMPLESQAFLRELIRSNLPIRNLVQSNFVMINDRLAKHYGIGNVSGSRIRKVQLPEGNVRGGFLTQASVLKVSANGTNTSPVVRGVWVLERILGETPLPPPPGVPGVEPDIRGATTLREQLDKHRNVTQCQSCHQTIDPPGFALECFDPIGGFRTSYRSMGKGERVNKEVNGRRVRYRQGPDVDDSGKLKSGKQFSDFRDYRNLLVTNETRLAKSFASKLATFATGRELGFSDREELDRLVESTRSKGYRVGDLIRAVVSSKIFLEK